MVREVDVHTQSFRILVQVAQLDQSPMVCRGLVLNERPEVKHLPQMSVVREIETQHLNREKIRVPVKDHSFAKK